MLSKQNSAYVVPNYIQNKPMQTHDTNEYEDRICNMLIFLKWMLDTIAFLTE